MIKRAYRVVSADNADSAERRLNELAEQGWVVVAVAGGDHYRFMWTLERKSEEGALR